MTAHVLDVEPAEYHRDPCPEPSLSCSLGTTLLDRSPLHARHEHPRLGAHRSTPTDLMERGTLIHRVLLGKGAELEAVDAKDWRTKAARAARDAAREAGKVPVLERVLTSATSAAAAIMKRLAELGVDLSGESELPIAWQEETAHGPIWCRCMLDHLASPFVYDVKVVDEVKRERCHSLVTNYAMQAHVYPRAVERLLPDLEGRVRFAFLFVEPDPPYDVLPLMPDGMQRAYGAERWTAAVAKWGKCLATNEWPGTATGIEQSEAPVWLRRRMEAA